MSYLPSHVLNIRTAFRRHFYRSPVRKGRNKSMKKKCILLSCSKKKRGKKQMCKRSFREVMGQKMILFP